jgi:hypothetical protein
LEHHLDDRGQQAGDDRHPRAHRRPRQLDVGPLEDRLLAIERQVVGILADGHVGQQSRAGQPFSDRLGESLCDHDMGLARLAGVLGPDVLVDDQRGGNIFELFAEFLADALAKLAAVRAGPLFERDIVDDSLARPAGKGLRP